ncbi:Ku protein [Streptomyces sp. LX-29]|uniref:non-homologous end joining protein Ku n=1 Tax=Streptomyces sp. LX-29 TaxID=2900152 RepID=UPI00240E6A5B|nr:Ku protein [Streptomyces sp. LX-29]WFB07811.1 Ku protein [Streptomyces sp. LX-29]
MRSIWNGAISFGLVSIPIKMYPATEDHAVSFRQIHTTDNGRIRYRKVCELEDETVDSAEIGKAYEDADGSLIPITDDDLAALPLPTTHSLEIEAFVPASQIDPLQMGDAYYLGAHGTTSAKPYVLLREALKRSEKVAITKYVHRGRERLGMLRVVGDTIAMHRLLWPDEIRDATGLAPQAKVTVKDAELDLADTLMDTLGEVDMDSLHDQYHEALEELVAAKVAGATPAAELGEAPVPTGKVVDLMAALQDSVRSARKARGEEGVEAAGETEATVTPLRGRGRKEAAAEKKPAATKKAASMAKKATGGRAAGSAAKKRAASGGTATGGAKKTAAAKKTTARRKPKAAS